MLRVLADLTVLLAVASVLAVLPGCGPSGNDQPGGADDTTAVATQGAHAAADTVPGPLIMDPVETEEWEIALVEWRIEKNEVFMDPVRSPLPRDMQRGFEGLDYYFPEPSWRFRLPLLPAAGADTLLLARSKDGDAPYVVRGTVRFRHGGQTHELAVLAPASEPAGQLWIPFHDPTNGSTTYGGGRYLDLEPAADGTVEVDFNKAYSPYCAYDAERWTCPLPPARNRLPVAVEAGEKLLTDAGAADR